MQSLHDVVAQDDAAAGLSIALLVKKRIVPKRTEKARRLKNELMGMPPLPV